MQGRLTLMLRGVKAKYPSYLNRLLDYLTRTSLGVFTKKAVLVFVGLLVAAFNIPAIALVMYSIKNGIPAFEAYDTVKDRIYIFVTASVFMTLLSSAFLILPGLAWWFDDPALKNLPWKDEKQAVFVHRWTIRRWYFVFLPGPVAVFLFLCCYQLLASQIDFREFCGGIAGILAGILLVLSVYAPTALANYRSRNILHQSASKISFPIWKPNFNVYTSATVYSLIYILILLGFFRRIALSGNFSFLAISQLNTLHVFVLHMFLFVGCFVLLFFGSVWANRRSFNLMIGFWLLHFCFLILIYPGMTTLLQGYMRMVRLGGGARVVITVDKTLAQNWPEMFETQNQSEGLARSKVLSLVLFGKEKVFISLPEASSLEEAGKNQPRFQGTLMLDHSVVHDILYID